MFHLDRLFTFNLRHSCVRRKRGKVNKQAKLPLLGDAKRHFWCAEEHTFVLHKLYYIFVKTNFLRDRSLCWELFFLKWQYHLDIKGEVQNWNQSNSLGSFFGLWVLFALYSNDLRFYVTSLFVLSPLFCRESCYSIQPNMDYSLQVIRVCTTQCSFSMRLLCICPNVACSFQRVMT